MRNSELFFHISQEEYGEGRKKEKKVTRRNVAGEEEEEKKDLNQNQNQSHSQEIIAYLD